MARLVMKITSNMKALPTRLTTASRAGNALDLARLKVFDELVPTVPIRQIARIQRRVSELISRARLVHSLQGKHHLVELLALFKRRTSLYTCDKLIIQIIQLLDHRFSALKILRQLIDSRVACAPNDRTATARHG